MSCMRARSLLDVLDERLGIIESRVSASKNNVFHNVIILVVLEVKTI